MLIPIHFAQHAEIVLIRRTNLGFNDLAVQRTPSVQFEAIDRPSRAESITSATKFASWRSLEGRDRKRLRIHSDEVQCLDFGSQLLEDRGQSREPDSGLRFRGEVRKVVRLQKLPPPAEIEHLVQFLKQCDGHEVSVRNVFVWMEQFRWNVGCDPVTEEGNSGGKRL